MKYVEAHTQMIDADDDFEPAARRLTIKREEAAVSNVKKLKSKQVPLLTRYFGQSVRASYLELGMF